MSVSGQQQQQQQQQQTASTSGGGGPAMHMGSHGGKLAQGMQGLKLQQRPAVSSCAEVCLELLTAEAVRFYAQQDAGPSPAAALQAVGMRVGERLAER
jgi:hypothetical protein